MYVYNNIHRDSRARFAVSRRIMERYAVGVVLVPLVVEVAEAARVKPRRGVRAAALLAALGAGGVLVRLGAQEDTAGGAEREARRGSGLGGCEWLLTGLGRK